LLIGIGFILLGLFYRFRKPVFLWVENRFSSYLDKKDSTFFYFRLKESASLMNRNIGYYLIISVMLWLVQGFEFYAMFLMFDLAPSIIDVYAGSFLALLAGAIPVSIAGLGPRDAVIINFFQSVASFELLAGIGIISLFRIIIPALIGLPFFLTQTKNS
jgi:uncharacterized membrane protein YbhN (UPF0104 family)